MTPTTELNSTTNHPGQLAPGEPAATPADSQFVCPFCGSVNDTAEGSCPRCTMENTPAGRKATKSRIGPWYVLQRRNPAAPGMKFETLMAFVKKGRIKPQSVVRGPTTHQLWRFAAHVKGLSREFGLCYSCGGRVSSEVKVCPQCNRLQDPPPNPDAFLENPAGAATAPAAGALPTPIYREIPAPPGGGQQREIEAARAALARPAERVANDAEDAIVTSSPESGDIDLVIPAIEPDVSASVAAAQEPQPDHEIVIPELMPGPLVEPLTIRGLKKPLSDPLKTEEDRSPAPRERRPAGRSPEKIFGRDGDESVAAREPVYLKDRLPPPGRPPGRDGGGPEPIPAPRPMPRMMAQRSRAGAEIAIFLLVIGVAVISGLLCVDPELRQQATGWLMRQSWIKGSSSGDATAAPSRVRQQDVPPLAATAPPSSPEPRDNQSPVNLPPAVSPPAEPVVTPPPAPVPAVIHEPDAAPPADGTPDHPVAAAPPPEAAPPPALSDAAARNRAKVLWRRALDADAAHDFQKEVELYEQIKKLPREYWQTNLELNLKFARASAAAQK